ncbi:putative UDP-glucuronate:xylan alpha-glucuronosyltransferase 5 [Humulus lupulus]|uniref:putative UDP-glucuronate:xylan alpha-glucuronosyltransferase 5 n=1 Tax=Humulus lupulus TaxID=3486 RepID=UPI002B41760F|nr:putative UDP-glucuronate:xylan alpha-glucuronosyltransferase 5 [Humulus lupulus]
MRSKNSYININNTKPYFAKHIRPFILFFLSLALLLLLAFSCPPKPPTTNYIFSTTTRLDLDHHHHHHEANIVISDQSPEWFQIIAEELNTSIISRNNEIIRKNNKIKLGLVNLQLHDEGLRGLHGLADVVPVRFDTLSGSHRPNWDNFYPEWIDENQKWRPPKCPEIPLPPSSESAYDDLDVVVASLPCGATRDVFALQVNLVVANLAARSGSDRTVYVVFVGSCGPMLEIFRCDDLMSQQRGEFWVYKPEMSKLRQKVAMPFGSCQLVPNHQTGKELPRSALRGPSSVNIEPEPQPKPKPNQIISQQPRGPRYAYATVLHSSESYVCGAIALAQSIRRTKSTRDLVLLADKSISPNSQRGLRSAGWQIVHIDRIRSPFAKKGAYNEWNYSKLRLWQLVQYDKIVFIDADLLVLNNLDFLFLYPQLSAAGNDRYLFNSGVMVIEPSNCLFKVLTEKTFELKSYNGGDQGFLNEVFTWWHRLPRSINYLKIFRRSGSGDFSHEVGAGEKIGAIHFLGLKPWLCYRDYDCNWDMPDHLIYASDSAHRRWWEVYDSMPKNLQSYCGLTKKMDRTIKKWRGIAKKIDLPSGHWKIQPKDPRRHRLVDGKQSKMVLKPYNNIE